MRKILFHLESLLTLLTLVTLIGLVTASAQVASQGGMPTAQQGAVQRDRDNDTTRGDLASFDRFMDSHPEIAEQLRKDPSLVKNGDFVRNHRDLQEYLQQHPGVSEEISENPARFMHQEQRFDRAEDRRNGDRRDDDTTRGELASFDRFMDSHREIAEQLRKDPSLVKNEDFVRNHRDLQEYLQQHPGVREEISENPDRFIHQEQRFDRAEDQRNNYRPDPDNDRRDNDRRDNDTTRGELASFDRFSDSHPEIAEQLRKDPSLVKNEDFVRNHRDLQEYLQQHPGVREEISENPDRFMRQEQRFDRHEDRDHDMARGELETFGQFLGNHSSIAQDLSKNPSLANSEEYQKNHPDFQQYLQTHPGVQAQLKQNPQVFMKSAQPAQPMGTSPTVVPKAPTTIEPMPKPPTVDPVPKQ
jgi:small nuclear ribonucleoprotein (snRNP)-like protein